MPQLTRQTRQEREEGRAAGTQVPLLQGLLGGLFGQGRRRTQNGGAAPQEPTPSTPQQRLEPTEQAVGGLAEAGQADIEGLRAAAEANRQAALAESREMKAGQVEVGRGFEDVSRTAEEGLRDVRTEIAETREDVNRLPDEVRREFDTQQDRLDAGLEQARTGIGEQRTEALAGVMAGQANAMDAAVSSIHGATQQQIASIDAQVQQGTLSPSQAEMMKTQIKMGSSMQLSAAVGQTAHAFTQTQAQVATSFGQMFTQFESTAQQTQAAFGAAAGGAFAQAQTASAQFNTQLTGLDAQATAQRDAVLSQNQAARASFQNANDTHNMAMLDYTQDQYIMTTPVAINNFQAQNILAGQLIKADQFQPMMDLMEQNMQLTRQGNMFQIVTSLLGMFTGG